MSSIETSLLRSRIKVAVAWIAKLLVLPFVLVFHALVGRSNTSPAFLSMSQLFSLIPGKTGVFLRGALLSSISRNSIHSDVSVGFLTTFSHANTTVETSVYIGSHGNIGMCHIGSYCLLGSGVHILSGKNQHGYADLDRPIRDQAGTFQKIRIGRNCWIGNHATIMCDVGDNCIVAAGAVVTEPVESNCIVAGNPARMIRRRKP